jgi:outer membrane protein OmpA-like peptidoglycan-associated protein
MYQWQPFKWIQLMAVGAGLPFLAAGILQTNSLVQDVSSRAMAAAAGPKVDFDGRDAFLSGEVASQEALDAAKKNVEATYGVRLVDVSNLKIVAPPPPPAPVTLAAPTVESITTAETQPMIKGTWPEGAAKTLEVTAAGKTYALGKDAELTSSAGNWMLMLPAPLAQGSYDVTANVTDGDKASAATAAPAKVVIEAPKAAEAATVPAPAKPAVVLAAPTVVAITTNNNQPTITGTYPTEAAKLMVDLGPKSYVLGTSPELTADQGKWTLKPAAALPDGEIQVTAKVEDADGKSSTASAPAPIVIDTKAPEAPAVTMAPAGTVWPYAITGKWDEMPGNTLALDLNNKSYAMGKDKELISDGKGAFTFVPTETLPPGKYDLNLIETDVAGNVTKITQKEAIIVEAPPPPPAPTPPPVAELMAPTVETSKSDSALPTIKGTWPAGIAKSLTVAVGGITHTLGTDFDLLSDASGKWTLTPKAELPNGTYDVVATVTDGADKSMADATKDELTVDVAAPPPPPPPPPKAAPDLAAPTVEASTSDSDHPTVKGTWPAGVAKSLTVDLDGVKHKLGTDFDLLSDASGHWTLKPTKPVVNGTYDVVATVTDGDKQSVSDTTKNELTVNVAPPPPAPPAAQAYDCDATLARIAAVFPVRFDTDKSDMKTPYDLAVNQYAALLKDPRCLALKIQVAGHADERGSEKYNQGLSERRAATVIAALTKAGIDGVRLASVGFSKDKPLDASHTADAHRKNRRAEFTVMK